MSLSDSEDFPLIGRITRYAHTRTDGAVCLGELVDVDTGAVLWSGEGYSVDEVAVALQDLAEQAIRDAESMAPYLCR